MRAALAKTIVGADDRTELLCPLLALFGPGKIGRASCRERVYSNV